MICMALGHLLYYQYVPHSSSVCGGSPSAEVFRNSPLFKIIYNKIVNVSLALWVSCITELFYHKFFPFPPTQVEMHPSYKQSNPGSIHGQWEVFTHFHTDFYLLVFYYFCSKLVLTVNRHKT